MFVPQVLVIFAVLVVSRQAPLDEDEMQGIAMECSRTHTDALLKKDIETEMLCTYKCILEKSGALSGGKIVVDKIVEEGPMRDCLEKIEIKECSDVEKFFICEEGETYKLPTWFS